MPFRRPDPDACLWADSMSCPHGGAWAGAAPVHPAGLGWWDRPQLLGPALGGPSPAPGEPPAPQWPGRGEQALLLFLVCVPAYRNILIKHLAEQIGKVFFTKYLTLAPFLQCLGYFWLQMIFFFFCLDHISC